MDDTIRKRLDDLLRIPRLGALHVTMQETYRNAPVFAHGWDHIHRVLVNTLLIAARLQDEPEPDMEIVVPAALLHDIGFLYNSDPYVHHLTGAEHCHTYLGAWNATEIGLIEGCIRMHKGMMARFNTKPTTLEERIVCDADLLEKCGYIGLMQGVRTFAEFGEGKHPEYRSLLEIAKHLMPLRDIEFFTSAGRSLADERGGLALRADAYKAAAMEMEVYY
ncbi:MAG: hypothetical protein CVV52_08580 [Spirochaetae bacterium HGW-Spirochaetae-8]|nr:MAG: hypothetical protein CVV52_08580 [Spirochaetae bacterium HGW-Spirochaetae-8]